MQQSQSSNQPRGVFVPLVTPFHEGKVDLPSYRKLVEHYIGHGVSGIIPLGTTGEVPTLDDDEMDLVIEETLATVANRVPVIVGAGGSATHKLEKFLHKHETQQFNGYLIVVPYYNRPSQEGIRLHFERLSEATSKQILIYNIPYRTGVNLQNDVLFQLAERKNIVGVKDCCANINQTLELLANRPAGFSVFTGDDNLYFTVLANGADGGILASAHLNTAGYLEIFRRAEENEIQQTLPLWNAIAPTVQLLFQEPNPGPLKYCLWKTGLIRSPECRLPLTSVSAKLRTQLDAALKSVQW